MTNVAVTVEDEPPPGQNLLGLYQGVPWGGAARTTRRAAGQDHDLPPAAGADRGRDAERLRFMVRRTVFHEIAHHFGISDQRAGRYRPLLAPGAATALFARA